MAGIKRDKRDDLFSKLVRERADWICESCGKQYERGSQGLHCSHFYSRRHRATRWHRDNAAAHCFACHQYLGGNPILFSEWINNHLGEARAEIVRDLHHSIVKFTKADLEDIHKHLKSEYKRVMDLRSAGVTGRIEFESPV